MLEISVHRWNQYLIGIIDLIINLSLVKLVVFKIIWTNWCFWTVGEDSWESLGLQRDLTSPSWRRSVLGVHWKDWCLSWSSNTLATWCEELTRLKRPWCWERLREGGEGDDRGWDSWMASPTQWTWVWVNCGSWWWTGKPGAVVHGVAKSQTRLSDWTELKIICLG